jgi:hypothetical protein
VREALGPNPGYQREVRSAPATSLAFGSIEGTPVGIAIRQRGIAVEKVVGAVAEALARIGEESPFASTMQALVVTARKAVGWHDGGRESTLREHTTADEEGDSADLASKVA